MSPVASSAAPRDGEHDVPTRSPRRFDSVDALRGTAVAGMLLVNTPGDWSHVYAPLLHARWDGCTLADFVFPAFLFVVGVSTALAVGTPRDWPPERKRAAGNKVLLRALRIVALGLLLHLLSYWLTDKPHLRVPGVLQRIGVCYAAVGLLAIHAQTRWQWILAAVVLVAYGAMLAIAGSAPFDSLAARVDTAVFGTAVYLREPGSGRGFDPEGLLSTFPAIVTTLLGLRAGYWLREGRLAQLATAGLICLAAGFGASWLQPFNKQLWTPSFVLWTAGWAMLALWLAHRLIERRGWPALGRSFGVNAIVAYVGANAMTVALDGLGWKAPIYATLFAGWMTPRFGPHLPSLAYALCFTALWWLVVRVLDRHRIHVKI